MPQAPRDFAPGIHHAWVNATGKEAYYVDDVDRVAWIRQLVRVVDRYGWTCIAFCQVTTHVHLIVETPDFSLPLGMKQLNLAYSRHFNERHARTGQFVRRRYGNRRIVSGSDLLGTYAYVVLNAVEAGLCPRPEDWRWSSYATTLGIANDFPFVDASRVLAEAGGADRLREFVLARLESRLSASDMSGV
ncbi:MAG TPA: transposase [Gaiellaceae bacterium]|nr:transposase [Gaiellaceae bacterium]